MQFSACVGLIKYNEKSAVTETRRMRAKLNAYDVASYKLNDSNVATGKGPRALCT